MAFVFTEAEDPAGRPLRCVDEGGHFDVAAGLRRVGHTAFNVYKSSRTNMEDYTVPPGAPPQIMVVDGGLTDVPMLPVSLEGVTVDGDGTMEGYRVTSFGWEKTLHKVREEGWKVPRECYTSGGGFRAEAAGQLAERVARAKARLGVRPAKAGRLVPSDEILS